MRSDGRHSGRARPFCLVCAPQVRGASRSSRHPRALTRRPHEPRRRSLAVHLGPASPQPAIEFTESSLSVVWKFNLNFAEPPKFLIPKQKNTGRDPSRRPGRRGVDDWSGRLRACSCVELALVPRRPENRMSVLVPSRRVDQCRVRTGHRSQSHRIAGFNFHCRSSLRTSHISLG